MAIQLQDKRIRLLISTARTAFGQYKRQIISLGVIGVLSGIFEGIGINAIIPIFSFASEEGAQTAQDPITRYIRQFFELVHLDFSMPYLLGFVIVLFIVRAIALVVGAYIKTKITTDYEKKTRDRLFKKTMRGTWPHLLKEKLGYLETILVTDVRQSAALFRQLSSALLVVTSLVMYVLIALNISATITLLTLAVGGMIFLILKPLLYRKRIVAKEQSKINKEVAHFVNESILGLKAIKSMLSGSQFSETGTRYFERLQALSIRSHLLTNIATTFMPPIALIFIVVLFAFSYQSPGFNFAAFAVVIYLVQKIFSYIEQVQSNLHQAYDCFPYLQNVLAYEKKLNENLERERGEESFVFKDMLSFNAVSFAYETGNPVLEGVSFQIPKGGMVGLIGPSGAGKTTIVDLFLRLLEPKAGTILLGKKDVQDIKLSEWRSKIGYVAQDIFLTHDTIANNIRFYDDSISDEQMHNAAQMADIHRVIERLPDGYTTVVGERGIRLSAGQRQRIVLARALARNPEILLLDEATSSLDNESEAAVQKVITGLKGRVTILVIAHRLSTVQNCDKLFVLEDGKIIEQGAPADLLKEKGSYFYRAYQMRK